MPRKSKSTTKEPSQESPTTTAAEPPDAGPEVTPEPEAPRHSFVEQVGRRRGNAIPDPFGIAGDYLAGVYLFESKEDGEMAIKFGDGHPEHNPAQRFSAD